MTETSPKLRASIQDHDQLRQRLENWLRGLLPSDAEPVVGSFEVPDGNGMSSQTVTFELTRSHGDAVRTTACVARMAPPPSAIPVFPVYDLERQFRVMRLVGEHSDVPVPRTLWLQTDAGAVGAPLFVMERIEGDVPPDVMPYNFGSWLSEADPADRTRLQNSTVAAIAGVHAIERPADDLAFLHFDRTEATALRRHVSDQWQYYRWVARERRHPLIERGFGWLEDHWPAEETPPVVSWGDARIGNILYRDFEPVGVLDWEMAAIGPRELDLGWLIYHHRFFEDLAKMANLDGMPDFLRADDVASTYEAVSGYTPRDLDFFIVYAALRNAIVMARIAQRQALLDGRDLPEDPDEVLYDRASLEALLA